MMILNIDEAVLHIAFIMLEPTIRYEFDGHPIDVLMGGGWKATELLMNNCYRFMDIRIPKSIKFKAGEWERRRQHTTPQSHK